MPGIDQPQEDEDEHQHKAVAINVASPSIVIPNSPLFDNDWYTQLPDTDHVRFLVSVDWGASLLGPLSTWDAALRLQTFAIISDSQPACLYWGPEKVAIYNEPFYLLAGRTHPRLMGSTFLEGFPEIFPQIKFMYDESELSGLAYPISEYMLLVERNGFSEEACFTGNFNPIRGLSGKIEGFHNSVHEVTKQYIAQRRMEMLHGMVMPQGSHCENVACHVMASLSTNDKDITMALLYEIDPVTDPQSPIVKLTGRIAVPQDHPIAVAEAHLNTSMEGIIPLLRKAQGAILNEPVDSRFDGILWKGYGEASKVVSILPLSGVGQKGLGFLVLGVNPRRPMDEDHNRFMLDIASRVSSIAGSVVSTNETMQQAKKLQNELATSTEQINQMIHHAPVGMMRLSPECKILWANDFWYELTGHPGSVDDAAGDRTFSPMDIFPDEDYAEGRKAWEALFGGEPKVTFEIRLKKLFTPPNGEPEPSTIESTSVHHTEEGKPTSYMTYITDISALKWAERTETRKAKEAYAAKKHQEKFIDTVSHEIRNPLTAILLSAESITKSLAGIKEGVSYQNQLIAALEDNADAANTIMMCANYQKRIVDDILTLSKLKHDLLIITPEPTEIKELVDSTLKMLEPQLQKDKILAKASPEMSLEANYASWVSCDPERLQIIIVNFLTNAIKFSINEGKREINVRFGAVLKDPKRAFPTTVNWAPVDPTPSSPLAPYERIPGPLLYLTFTVEDEGEGMDAQDMQNLFHRFTQANIRTSINYGGSGLGLSICKKLAERMGGEIGVISTKGVGTTFVFYIEANRANPQEKKSPTLNEFPFPSRSKSVGSELSPGLDLNHMHVLIVEDNIVNQTVLAKQLSKAGCIVTIANHGLEALERLEETRLWRNNIDGQKLDIILMDWEMPVMDGLTCAREIRKLEATGQLLGHVEIIATTANARSEQLEKALESGIDSVMPKPFKLGDLLKQMRAQLSKVDNRIERSITA